MITFAALIKIFIYLSLGLSLIQFYLRANKIWKRKHEREVAESQSIAGLSLLLINCFLWVVYYIIEQDYSSILDTTIIIAETTVFLLISTGLWVKRKKGLSFWALFKQALNLEKQEADYLLKKFFKPHKAELIINLLHQLAMIDENLDEKEKELIQMFANEWNIYYSPDKLNKERKEISENPFIRLRNTLNEYLSQNPPTDQAGQLQDLMNELIAIDDQVTAEEELIISELMGLIDTYLDQEKKREMYHVIIVPQDPSHENVVKELSPDSEKIRTAGGTAFSVESFYSLKYAQMVCNEFRQKGLFTIVHFPEETNEINLSN
jgi:hypothetical protein